MPGCLLRAQTLETESLGSNSNSDKLLLIELIEVP